MPKRIPDATLEQLKHSVDLLALIASRGVILKKTGQSYKALCPFHQEKTPSLTVTPAKGLWHCFGCGKGGDAIRFIELMDGVTFTDAVKRLTSNALPVAPAPKETVPTTVSPASRVKLLNRVANFYHQRFLDQPEGLRYLTKVRGLQNIALLKSYRVGLADGSLLDALPGDDESLARFKTLGLLSDKGHELFEGCVVFPLFDEQGNVVNFYGRRLDDGPFEHFYLPPPRGLWNYQAAKRSASILLAESVIDALTLVDRGFADVMPCYGTNGLTEEILAWLERCNVKEVTLCFDADPPGRDGSERAIARLKEKRIAAHVLTLPDGEDINSFLNRYHVAELHKLFAAVPTAVAVRPTPTTAPASAPIYQATNYGFLLKIGARHYDIKAIARSGTQLKATIKASGEKASGFELHTLDLYSQRSREAFARSCAALFQAEETLIKNDLAQVLERVESWQPQPTNTKTVELSDAEKNEALGFLRSADLLTLIQHDLTTLGVAGEDLNKILCYLACISRKLDDPLSLLIQSRSAAGKSTLQNAVLSLMPDEDKVVYTRMTDQSLFYQDENALVHKVLALEEAEGLGGAAYSLRALQSSKSLNIATTTKDPATGKMRTEHYSVKGPVAVLLTTTQPDLDEETRSRFLTLTIDESAKMTESIFARQRHADTLPGYMQSLERAAIVKRHHAVQRLLEPLVVINPYAEQLTFAAHSLRARRDHKKYLMLIKAVAFLHQKQREVKETSYREEPLRYIEVTRDDIRKANELARHVLGSSADELSAPARRLLKEIHTMVKRVCEEKKIAPRDVIFTRRTIREHIQWSDWQVRTHIQELETLEYLRVRTGAWGKEYVYELTGDTLGLDERLALVDPDQLKEPA